MTVTYKKAVSPSLAQQSMDDSDNDSCYTDDENIQYTNETGAAFASGAYASVRAFEPRSVQWNASHLVVLKPIPTPKDGLTQIKSPSVRAEVLIKARFFRELYPEHVSHLFLYKEGQLTDSLTAFDDYRLVLPRIPGETFKKFKKYLSTRQKTLTDAEVLEIFLSAARALKKAHDAGLLVLDLYEENILYDSSTKSSYLIDGGLSVPLGELLNLSVLQVKEIPKLSPHIAPECWTLLVKKQRKDGSSVWVLPEKPFVQATASMDIYSLGTLMMRLLQEYPSIPFKSRASLIRKLIQSCSSKNPQKRPSLDGLINQLQSAVAWEAEIQHDEEGELTDEDDLQREEQEREELEQLTDALEAQAAADVRLRKQAAIQHKISEIELKITKKQEGLARSYGVGHPATQKATQLKFALRMAALQLKEDHYEPEALTVFKSTCQRAITDAGKVLNEHRGWTPLLLNAALAISLLGVGYLLVAVTHKCLTGRFMFFTDSSFVPTKSAEMLAEVSQNVQAI